MRNKDFSKLTNLERVFGTLRNVAMVITIISSLAMFVGGIIVCVYVDISTGVSSIISSLIIGGFGTYMIFCSFMFANATIEAMADIKQTSIAVEEMQKNQSGQFSLKLEGKSYETSTCYLLRYIDKGAYLSSTAYEERALKVTKSIMTAIQFQSETEAKKFADYKGLPIGEKWDIVKKDLIVPIE